jgi:plastocyanin
MRMTRWSRPAKIVVALLATTMTSLAASPSASASQTAAPRTWQVSVGEETDHDAIQGMAFLPGEIWINQGDRIVWTVRAGEIHTVTFLAKGQPLTPFNPADPTQLFPQGGSVYDGVSYFNSGVLSDEVDSGFPAGTSYSLSFNTAGDFTYYCLVHGAMMKGVVHVRATGTHYPFTQAQYNAKGAALSAAIFRDGFQLWHQQAAASSNHKVFAGADDGMAMVMRWIGQKVHVHVGQSVTFVNNGVAAPHTVTFGTEQPNIFVPYGDPTHFSGQPLNSGLFLPGATFTVTFVKKGTYRYICGLHDYMHMVGWVVVD